LAEHGIITVAELAAADPDGLVAEFGPRMGPWYAQLARGEGAQVVDDTPWVARGHSRETTFQQDLTDPDQVEEAVRELVARVLEDVETEGRPVVGLTLKVRYSPFITKTYSTQVAQTFDREVVLGRALELVGKVEPDRAIRLLGLRAEMPMPEEAREGHTPTRSGW
jgi:DNA polymerase-4